MPTKEKYHSIKNNPERLDHKRDYDAKWIKVKRCKYPFTHFSKDFYHRKRINISPIQFWRLAKKQKLVCPLTGRKLDGNTMSLDHIVPVSKGGSHDLSNLQFVHIEANYAKRNLIQEDFIQLCCEVYHHQQIQSSLAERKCRSSVGLDNVLGHHNMKVPVYALPAPAKITSA